MSFDGGYIITLLLLSNEICEEPKLSGCFFFLELLLLKRRFVADEGREGGFEDMGGRDDGLVGVVSFIVNGTS